MESLKEKVATLVKERFDEADTELEIIPKSKKLSGYVIWQGFVGESHRERQQQLWRVLREALKPEEQAQVSALLTLSPAEMQSLRQEDF
jgi:hypothetical protein